MYRRITALLLREHKSNRHLIFYIHTQTKHEITKDKILPRSWSLHKSPYNPPLFTNDVNEGALSTHSRTHATSHIRYLFLCIFSPLTHCTHFCISLYPLWIETSEKRSACCLYETDPTCFSVPKSKLPSASIYYCTTASTHAHTRPHTSLAQSDFTLTSATPSYYETWKRSPNQGWPQRVSHNFSVNKQYSCSFTHTRRFKGSVKKGDS